MVKPQQAELDWRLPNAASLLASSPREYEKAIAEHEEALRIGPNAAATNGVADAMRTHDAELAVIK